jgi:hypothetical protein
MNEPVIEKFGEACIAIRFVDWVRMDSKGYLLGVVVENKDGTALKVYEMNREGGFGQWKAVWTI